MIPKADIVALADEDSLFRTTVDKDYVLGWLLYGIAEHPVLSHWIFTGGTCLKKCFFETYRFSEDLDFTVPKAEPLTEGSIETALEELCEWVNEECGISFPAGGLKVERYTNKRGTRSYPRRSLKTGQLWSPENRPV